MHINYYKFSIVSIIIYLTKSIAICANRVVSSLPLLDTIALVIYAWRRVADDVYYIPYRTI